ncbi:MAG TPA: hypothetical protein VG756_29395 [Pseudonocardiaceae bacterium]|nr:hypothetical protein [Pseudonocardiaceae bacterium]
MVEIDQFEPVRFEIKGQRDLMRPGWVFFAVLGRRDEVHRLRCDSELLAQRSRETPLDRLPEPHRTARQRPPAVAAHQQDAAAEADHRVREQFRTVVRHCTAHHLAPHVVAAKVNRNPL